MLSRRQFMGTIPTSALCISAASLAAAQIEPRHSTGSVADPLIASPPVVQHPRKRSFGVSIAVSGLATARVEWGLAQDDLKYTAVASHHGLIAADDKVLHIQVSHDDDLPTDSPIYYRVVAQPLSYQDAYHLTRGEEESTEVHALKLPDPDATTFRIVSINDTHENLETIRALHVIIGDLNPDLLIWNGDTCNDFDAADAPQQVMLNPAMDCLKGWASTRPLLFSNGNHDVRGERAREAAKSFPGVPESRDLPYNVALRFGPLALITLDTGEDKPDAHPVFAGTAAYEPYREAQATWLQDALATDAIKSAPFKIATCHIPLRGLPGQPDGTTLEGYARFSGFGAKLWLPLLQAAGCQAILSGHTHAARLNATTEDLPAQFVGGGPGPQHATVTIIDTKQTTTEATLDIRILDLDGKSFGEQQWTA